MQVRYLLSLTTLVCCCLAGKPKNSIKFTRVNCSTSGQTCSKMICNVKPINRFESLMNVECAHFIRPMDQFKFHIAAWKVNLAGNLRQIVNIRDVQACSVLNNIHLFPIFKSPVDWLENTFPTCVHKCPYTELKCLNSSMKLASSDSRVSWQSLPNGKFKNTMRATDDTDDNIFTLTYWYESSFFLNDMEMK